MNCSCNGVETFRYIDLVSNASGSKHLYLQECRECGHVELAFTKEPFYPGQKFKFVGEFDET